LPYYESVFIARQDIASSQVESLADTFTKVLEDLGGRVAKREFWGLRALAFRIKKNRKGHYVLLNIDAQPPAIHELERQMRINEDVLRYLTVRVDELEEGPSAMVQNRYGREERGGRRDGRPPRGGEGGEGRGPREPSFSEPARSRDGEPDREVGGFGGDES
jgi:small subunit ribosomal protein S6